MIPIPAATIDRFGLTPPRLKKTFFADHRKGEVGELRLLLKKMASDYGSSLTLSELTHRDYKLKCREILKRLIRSMTLGMDVSRLYTDVVMISQTTDPVQKKMIYMYLSTYSKDHPEQTILTINTLLKDFDNVDPVIRSLAIRNLSAFDTKLSNEYAMNVVLKKFLDPSDTVKRSAVIGALRLYKSQCAISKTERLEDSKDEEVRSDILHHLQSSIKSLNLDVMFDSLCVYSELVESDDDLRLSRPSIVYLINRIKRMNEWQQCLTLKLLHTYIPSGDELFDLLNLLDEFLNYTSSAVFLATAKCFLAWTAHDDMLQLEVIRRLQIPMVALIAQSCNEIAYNIMLNIMLLVINAPQIEESTGCEEAKSDNQLPFSEHYDVFYFRYDDPPYIKHAKLKLLVAIACEENATNILNDLNEYVSDINYEIGANSVKSMGLIALKVPGHLDVIISQISVVFGLRLSHIVSAALYVVRTLLRAFPESSEQLLSIVEEHREYINDIQSLTYYIWILGEHGCNVDHAPYTMEDIIDRPESLDIGSELLSASMKLFFARPPEMYNAISRLFTRIITENQDPSLLGMAVFYHSLLYVDIEIAKKVVLAKEEHDLSSILANSMVELGIPLRDDDWREKFDSVDLLQQGQARGTALKSFFPYSFGNVESDIFTTSMTAEHSFDEDSTEEDQPSLTHVAATTPIRSGTGTDLDHKLSTLNLVIPNTLLTEEYQKCWFECDLMRQSTEEVSGKTHDLNVEPLEDMLFDVHIATLASGKSQEIIKMYQYAQNADGQMYYIELAIEPLGSSWRVQVSVKSQSSSGRGSLVQTLASVLCSHVCQWLKSLNLT